MVSPVRMSTAFPACGMTPLLQTLGSDQLPEWVLVTVVAGIDIWKAGEASARFTPNAGVTNASKLMQMSRRLRIT